MNPVLRILAPKEPPVEYELERDSIRLGRLEGNDIVVKTRQVSAVHLDLKREGADFRLIDRGSTNGTKVNGAAVTETLLKDGDEILIGGAVAAIYTSAAAETSAAPAWRGSSTLPPARPPIKIAKPMPPLAGQPGKV